MRPDLFGNPSFGFLPAFHDDETLFSWGAQYHRRSGNVLARESSLNLYGHGKAGLRHDFPFCVDRLLHRSNHVLGSAEALILHRTVFGLYAPFLDDDRRARAIELMRGESISALKSTLGLMASRVGALHPLRACPRCLAEMRAVGNTWWRLGHQWPGVVVCLRHHMPLHCASAQLRLRDLRRWALPEDLEPSEWVHPKAITDRTLSALIRLAEFVEHFARKPERRLNTALLRTTYLLGARMKGLLVPSGAYLHFQDAIRAIGTHYAGVGSFSGLEFVDQTDVPHGGFLGLLTRSYRSSRHPAKHAVLMAFLFESPPEFEEAYESVRAASESGDPNAIGQLLGPTRYELERQILTDGQSVNSAARQAGVSTASALKWVRKDAVPYVPRPRMLNAERESHLTALLASSLSADEIAREVGIKKSLLRAYLAKHSSLRDEWNARQLELRKSQYRARFVEILACHPGVPMKAIKRIPGNGFAWLCRHDKEWLVAHLPNFSSASSPTS